jgi:hypothetical protein
MLQLMPGQVGIDSVIPEHAQSSQFLFNQLGRERDVTRFGSEFLAIGQDIAQQVHRRFQMMVGFVEGRDYHARESRDGVGIGGSDIDCV